MNQIAQMDASDDEITEFLVDPADQASAYEESDDPDAPRPRGRQKVPEMWTRVVRITATEPAALRTY